MSETTTDTAAAQAGPDSTDEPKVYDADYVRKLRDEAAKYRTQARENSAAATRLAELEESQKSEIQKANERAEVAERALVAKEAEALRLTVAARHGITGDHLDLLSGADEAELEAKAKKLAALIAPKEEPQDTPKGVVGPYVPGEGRSPRKNLGSTADMFAASIENAFS